MIKNITILAAFTAAWSNIAHADVPANEFLQALEGIYRGKGEAVMPVSQKTESLRCSLTNSFNLETKTLEIDGRCATVQGKSNVKGSLVVKDTEIVGSFISPFDDVTITQSTNEYTNGKLVVSTSFVDNKSGKLSKLRQVIKRKDDDVFEAVFLKFDNASSSYLENGSVVFQKRAE